MNVQTTMNIKDYKEAENSSYNANGIQAKTNIVLQWSLATIWAKLIGKRFKNIKI
jgi:hypothetical protein